MVDDFWIGLLMVDRNLDWIVDGGGDWNGYDGTGYDGTGLVWIGRIG